MFYSCISKEGEWGGPHEISKVSARVLKYRYMTVGIILLLARKGFRGRCYMQAKKAKFWALFKYGYDSNPFSQNAFDITRVLVLVLYWYRMGKRKSCLLQFHHLFLLFLNLPYCVTSRTEGPTTVLCWCRDRGLALLKRDQGSYSCDWMVRWLEPIDSRVSSHPLAFVNSGITRVHNCGIHGIHPALRNETFCPLPSASLGAIPRVVGQAADLRVHSVYLLPTVHPACSGFHC